MQTSVLGTHPLPHSLPRLLRGNQRRLWYFLSLKDAVFYVLPQRRLLSASETSFSTKGIFGQLKTSATICPFTHQQLSCPSPLQEETCLPKDGVRDRHTAHCFNKTLAAVHDGREVKDFKGSLRAEEHSSSFQMVGHLLCLNTTNVWFHPPP